MDETESPEIDLHVYGKLVGDKGAKIMELTNH